MDLPYIAQPNPLPYIGSSDCGLERRTIGPCQPGKSDRTKGSKPPWTSVASWPTRLRVSPVYLLAPVPKVLSDLVSYHWPVIPGHGRVVYSPAYDVTFGRPR